MTDDYTALGNDASLRQKLCADCDVVAIEFADTIDSTQRRARELANTGAPDWTIVVADFQSAGRGQHGRRWIAAPGTSVMFSVLLRPTNHDSLSLLPVRAGLVIADALDSIVNGATLDHIKLKWPNDLVVRDAKLGGILCDGHVRGDDTHAIVGVGVNVHPSEPAPGLTSTPSCINSIANRIVSRYDVLHTIIAGLRTNLDLAGTNLSSDEMARYATRDWLRGRTIVAPTPGTVVGINDRGHLIVRSESGMIENVVSGSVGF